MLTLTQVGGSGIAKLFSLSESISMQRFSKFVEICTAFTVVMSGAIVYFAWGTDFPNPRGHEKEVATSFISVALVPALIASPITTLMTIGVWRVVQLMVLRFFDDVIRPLWQSARGIDA
ncbi:hypothetical protein M2405_004129 [Rhodococcus erythropolis]|nr:hypothetical protein [Rhodococcus erythropolis]MCW2425343.1 hypothetical protein [Rhodococcus erythropolis]